MKLITSIYDKFLTWFNLQRIPSKDILAETHFNHFSSDDDGWLSFHLKNNNSIVVGLNIPNTTNINSDDIVDISEKYAGFLVHINNGLMQEEVIKLLQSTLEKTTDLNKQLFLKNTLYFLPILENELEQAITKKYIHNQPVIRPIHVFNNQK